MGKPEKFYEKRKSVLNFNSDDWYVECPVIKAIKEPVMQKNIPPAPTPVNKPEQTFVSQDMVTTDATDNNKESKKGLFIGLGIAAVCIVLAIILYINFG